MVKSRGHSLNDDRNEVTVKQYNEVVDLLKLIGADVSQNNLYSAAGNAKIDGTIRLDNNKTVNVHVPIHEYTHLWDHFIQIHNPQLWDRGVELMKQTSLWKTV